MDGAFVPSPIPFLQRVLKITVRQAVKHPNDGARPKSGRMETPKIYSSR